MTVLPLGVKHLNEFTRRDLHWRTRNGDNRFISVKLCHYKPLNRIVQWVQPVHKRPESREILRLDHESAEKRNEG